MSAAETSNGRAWPRHKEASVFCLSWLSVVLGCSMLLRKAALEILCLTWRLQACEVKCLCLNKHLSWEELGCWSTAGWELAAGPDWELRRILWQSWHRVFDCLFSTFRCNRYPGAAVTKLARCCCRWFSNCTEQCGGIEGGDGCERNSCLENHRGIFMPGILSYLLSPKVAPLTLETVWHLKLWGTWPWGYWQLHSQEQEVYFAVWNPDWGILMGWMNRI